MDSFHTICHLVVQNYCTVYSLYTEYVVVNLYRSRNCTTSGDLNQIAIHNKVGEINSDWAWPY